MLVHGWFGCYGMPGWRSRSARLQRRFWGSAAKSVDAGLQAARHVAHVQVGLVEDIAQPAKGGPALGLMGAAKHGDKLRDDLRERRSRLAVEWREHLRETGLGAAFRLQDAQATPVFR